MRLLERLISSQMLSKRESSTTGISDALYIRVNIIKKTFNKPLINSVEIWPIFVFKIFNAKFNSRSNNVWKNAELLPVTGRPGSNQEFQPYNQTRLRHVRSRKTDTVRFFPYSQERFDNKCLRFKWIRDEQSSRDSQDTKFGSRYKISRTGTQIWLLDRRFGIKISPRLGPLRLEFFNTNHSTKISTILKKLPIFDHMAKICNKASGGVFFRERDNYKEKSNFFTQASNSLVDLCYMGYVQFFLQSRPILSPDETSKNFYQTKLRYDKEPVKEGDMEVALEETLSRMESELQNIREEHPEDWFDEVTCLIYIRRWHIELDRDSYRFFLFEEYLQVYRMYKDRTNWFNYTDGKSNLIINGAYSIYYRRWLENFDASQILPVDGTDMLQNPAKWTLAVQVIIMKFQDYKILWN